MALDANGSSAVSDVWVLVIDDDPDSPATVLEHLDSDVQVIGFTSPEDAVRLLEGDLSATSIELGDKAPRAVLAIADLWLGPGRSSGLTTVDRMAGLDIPVATILRSSETDSGRELLAIACSEVAVGYHGGCGIAYLPKDATEKRWGALRSIVDDLHAGVLNRFPTHPDLLTVKPLVFTSEADRSQTFLQWLGHPKWRLEYLRAVADGFDPRQARESAFAPAANRDIAAQLDPLLLAHDALATEGRWMSHDGHIDASRVAYDKRQPYRGGRKSPSLNLVIPFAVQNRFLLSTPNLRPLIDAHIRRLEASDALEQMLNK
jgi:hypothetical protein